MSRETLGARVISTVRQGTWRGEPIAIVGSVIGYYPPEDCPLVRWDIPAVIEPCRPGEYEVVVG